MTTGEPAALSTDSAPSGARKDLRGTVAIVTGGGRGIGRVLAAGLAGSGASVGLIARTADQLADSRRIIGEQSVATAVADVTDERQLRRAIRELTERLGPADLLVNNAGVDGPSGAAWEADPDRWWRAIEVNLRGVFLGCRIVLPDMIARGGGRIVNVTSEAGAYRWPLMSAYSVSKAAAIKFTENLAVECKSTGVSVFSVHPGLTPIGFSEQPRYLHPEPGTAEAQVAAWVRGQIADGNVADPSMGSDLLLRLASGEADQLSGCHISVHDDLTALIATAAEIRRNGSQMLRLGKARPG